MTLSYSEKVSCRDILEPFGAAARPLHGQLVYYGLVVEAEIKPRAVLRRIARTRGHMPHLPASSRFNPHLGADGVAVTLCALQFDCEPVASLTYVVVQECSAGPFPDSRITRVVVYDDVESAVIVEVRDRHSSAILVVIGSHRHPDVGEPQHAIGPLSFVSQHYVMLVAVPGDISSEFIGVELAGLVLFYVRDRAQDIGQSEIIFFLPADPTIHRVDVLAAIVVVVKNSGAPKPAKWVDPSGLRNVLEVLLAMIQ